MTAPTGIPPRNRSPVARTLGALLASGFGLLQRPRPPRPIHSRGIVLRGEMRWIPDAEPAGVSFIDDAPAGPAPVVARVSRSIGLPAPLPDVIGLAVRVDLAEWDGGRAATLRGERAARQPGTAPSANGETDTASPVADIELASAGWSVPARFLLLPHRRAERARLGSLLPFRGTRGAVLLVARTASGRPPATDPRELDRPDDAPWVLTLGHATPAGPWHPFARLVLRLDPEQNDHGLRFDAVRRPIPGARWPAWVRAVRQPSYVRVQGPDDFVRMPGTSRAATPGIGPGRASARAERRVRDEGRMPER